MNARDEYVYRRDMAMRIPQLSGPVVVHLAAGLEQHPGLGLAEPVLTSLRQGGDMSSHISPMKAARNAFKKATASGDWSRYARMMDLLLNKWGIHHFHVDGGRMLVFVVLDGPARSARILDIVSHDKSWAFEKRLVEIAVRNWPDQRIAVPIGKGQSSMGEDSQLAERKIGTNMPVEVDGTFYLPRSRGLMSDGSGYDTLMGITPVAVVARRSGSALRDAPQSAQLMIVGVDSNDPRSPHIVAADSAARLAVQTRRERAHFLVEAGLGPVAEAVRRVVAPYRR